ncbi:MULTISPECIES: leucyl aminopeptidase [unclassified Sphingopyxis]|uniref:leucyl aminopeptidase n=1 Tax=unclassified Sphingopyxis TaxID=2614943 RepID=UPI000731CA27|nr:MULTISPECIES: leucyl aminopeptidase [unclassified Sphingopyxis]KTE27784.1 aminopeptidase [Sphingopyxis sp. H057]KTE55835.1 aminopeptidase [Sphingopyxis sp. H073]KTE56477.1 aminopeptidase [Sphingopyxis sp. H107]KTE57284.1 aminopeptidase [Sphingopyxis sp. H071]KTE65297.1 aminopeptidase [Sphingopyxis sp. H100]
MDIQFVAQIDASADVVAFPVRKGEAAKLGALLGAAAAQARFEGAAGAIAETAAIDGDQARRLLLVGIGDGTTHDLERGGAALTARLQTSGVTAVHVDFASAGQSDEDDVLAFAMGARLRDWRLDTYRTRLSDTAKPSLKTIVIASPAGDLSARWGSYSAVADGVALTQTLVAEPPNILYPESFVERCQHLAELGVELEVLDERQMKALGMGALLGVAQGSTRPPRLLAMRWNGGTPGEAPVVFIGKGVTFDTGGISLKPGPGMDMMKWDMGGAGAVAGAMKAIAGRKAKANVVGVVGLVENMPDGNAMRPGDIVTTMSGQTVEVLNTDAEGRLVLCDAITWAQKAYNPKVIVDLATLTGAMVISLGHEYAGMFANDDELAAKLLEAGDASGNKLWRFPLSPAYDKLIDSPIADMKNIGPREGGSITAAQFLKRYVNEGVAWAHLDIAGMAWGDKDGPVWAKGATGYGVRLLDRYIADNHES